MLSKNLLLFNNSTFRLFLPASLLLKTLSLSVFLFLSQLLIASFAAVAATPWKKATGVAPRGLIGQVVKENFNLASQSKVDLKEMRLLKIQGQKQTLYVVDPNTNLLCGAGGCAVFGYIPRSGAYHKVFSIYLPKLPAQVPLIQPASKTSNGLPCLDFTQSVAPRIETSRWCYNGQQYTSTSSPSK